MTDASNLARLAYEARFATWPKGTVPAFDRLPPDHQAIWEGVADAVAAPQTAALINAIEQMAFASAALKGAGDVRIGLIAEVHKLRLGLVAALDEMERATVFVNSREKRKQPEGAALWAVALQNAREALHPPTADEIAKVAQVKGCGEHANQIGDA